MLFAALVETSRTVAGTRSRLGKVGALADAIESLGPEEIEAGIGFLSGEIRQGRLGVGYARLRELEHEPSASTPTLSVLDVDRAFEAIRSSAGRGSSAERQRLLGALFAKATRAEQEFLVRLLLGELRQGALESLVVDAIARATGLPLGSVRRAVMLTGSAPLAARTALLEGAPGLDRFALELFRPLSPMLAASGADLETALSDVEGAALEYKLDGARIQVHRAGDDVRVFTRNLNDVTQAVPEVVEAVRRLPVRELVLDGEAIAFRRDGTPQPFQVTMRRFGRRLDVDALRSELPLSSLFFDCLQLDGRTLIDLPNAERAEALAAIADPGSIVPRIVRPSLEEAERFTAEALSRGHEGTMVKALDAPYEAGRRGAAWLKIKPAHTLDLVVLAAEWGSGRRSGWLSNLHLGARDLERGGHAMLGKTFKGMTDAMLAFQTEKLQALATRREGHVVYVKPELVVEIAFDGVQASSQYESGFALRFARVKRYRPDKPASEAATLDEIREIFTRSHGSEQRESR